METVDYEGALPPEAGNFTGTPKEQTFTQSTIAEPDPGAPAGLTLVADLFEGPTVPGFPFEESCIAEEGFSG